jgi:putative ABC transport system substrate-binding protein
MRRPAVRGVPRGLLTFVAVVVGGLSLTVPSDAQRPVKIARIGYLTPISQPPREEVFRREMRRLGYAEGVNFSIQYRSADGRFEQLPDLAEELVRLKVDVIVAVVTQAALAAKTATATIPIVMVAVADPVGTGLVASIGRPGGNVTGTSTVAADVVGKQLELLREMLPRASRVSALWNPANSVFQKRQIEEARTAAAKLKVQLQFVEARTPDELDRAFAAIAGRRTDALFILGDPMLSAHFSRIADFAARHRLPTVSATRENVDAGALMTYGPSYNEAYRRAATYVDRVLKGDRPADLPIEQSTKFELVINTRTARAIGVTIPPSLAVRADQLVR